MRSKKDFDGIQQVLDRLLGRYRLHKRLEEINRSESGQHPADRNKNTHPKNQNQIEERNGSKE